MLKELIKIFPDVKKGTVLYGVKTIHSTTQFYQNDVFLGEVKDIQFTQRFFNIWLGEKTSEPKMRQTLLGLDDEK